jgi:long-chain fatty acid transport protein
MMSLIHLSKHRCLAAAVLLLPGVSLAAGFSLIEQSVSSMGTAYANGSSGMDDASTIYYNPASMTRLEGRNASGGVHVIHSNTDFDGKGFYDPSLPFFGGASTGNNGKDDIGLTAAVPHGGYSHQLNDQMWMGLTINGPFGLKTKYDNNWVGRYHAIKSDLKTVNINPSIAYEINDKASVGAGVSALYADGELTNAVDGGLLGSLASIGLGGPPIPGWVPGSDTLDSFAKLTGDDWGYGWNVGLLLEPTPDTRIGLHYRSKVDLTLEGDIRDNGPVVNLNTGAKLDVTLPPSASLSALHALNPKWTVMADVTWMKWDELDELRVEIDNGSKNVTPLKWDNATRVSVGASYQHNPAWLFRTGVAYDKTPVPKDSLRTPRVPDADRVWLTFGANYHYSKALSFDFGYAHLFVDDPKLNTDSSFDPTLGQSSGFHKVKGDYDAAVDIVSVQANWKF